LNRFQSSLLLFSCLLLTIQVFGAPKALAPAAATVSYTFSSPQAVELNSLTNSFSSALQASDGTIWIAWQYYLDQGVYATDKAGVWSSILPLPTGSRYISNPNFAQLRNGSIILSWSSNQTGHWNLYYRLNFLGVWKPVIQLTSGTFDDYFPSVAVGSNSTVYLFWERVFSTGSIMIYYKTLKNNVWSSDTPLTSGASQDLTPSALSAYDGKIWVAWSRVISSTSNSVYYRNYNGTGWSPEFQLTTKNYDIQPSLVQDRNGTILIFYSRQMSLGSNIYQQKLWFDYTTDGTTWSSETQLTSYGDSTTPLDDFEPSVIQGVDKSLWIFYSTDYPLGTDYNIFYIRSNAISPTHNVVISQVQSGPIAFQNNFATVLVTVSNPGDYSETVQVTITAVNLTSYTIASAVTETVPAGSTISFAFGWSTTAVPLGTYLITVSYPRLSGQSFLASGGDSAQYKYLTILPPIKSPGCKFMLRNCPI
jgi:hypothetical protein